MVIKNSPHLYIVHCVDTEGPLFESIEATFLRLKKIFNIELDPSYENLKKIQNQEIDFGSQTELIANSFNQHILNYNDSWEKIDLMLNKIMTKKFREKFLDSYGKGIIYNWHCMDNVGFETNLRQRDIGFGKIFSYYKKKISEHRCSDKIHWHFHPLSFNKEGHICNTSYDNSYTLLHEIICRRLIDHNWFPTVNRAGFHAVRQDSSFFLEQWIPFDYSNQSTYNKDLSSDVHRYGDWRRASKNWIPYHPSYNDYQIPGNMNRLSTKCLNIGTRFNLLTDEELTHAFEDSIKNGMAILSFTNHDFRDMSVDILDIYKRIHQIHKKFKSVKLVNSDAISAMQSYKTLNKDIQNINIKIHTKIIKENSFDKIVVDLIEGNVFGSQPYLALKTKDGRYYHDNFNEREHNNSWEYILDESSIKLQSIEKISVASNNEYGNQSITSLVF